MTPEQKLKREIIHKCQEWEAAGLQGVPPILEETIDETFSNGRALYPQYFQDAIEEIRSSGEDSGIPDTNFNRHYESKQVAMKCCDGSWVGWTYWYGGGKHGNPDEIDWLEEAYDVSCTVEMQPVNVFTKP